MRLDQLIDRIENRSQVEQMAILVMLLRKFRMHALWEEPNHKRKANRMNRKS